MNNSETDENKNIANGKGMNRKAALKQLSNTGKKALLTALPLSLISLSPKKAAAQFEDLEAARALSYILQIEFLEEAFYLQATSKGDLMSPQLKNIFVKIRRQHQRRVVLIKNVIGTLEVEPVPQLIFDLSAGGQITPFRSLDNFLAFAQIIEDLAVGVYKEQANNIYQNNASNDIKQLVLRLHSTETRHAYYMRSLRAEQGFEDIKGWINRSETGNLPPEIENIYVNESSTTQQEIEIPSVTDAPLQAVQEAWDEPIDRGLANTILQLFTRPL